LASSPKPFPAFPSGAENPHLEPFRERYRRIVGEPGYPAGVPADGAARVAPVANATVRLVKKRMGLCTYGR
jgi:hypothetical protein